MVFRNHDRWRNHPMVRAQHRHALMGLRTASIIFGAYLVADFVVGLVRPDHGHGHHGHHGHHDEAHGAEHGAGEEAHE